MQFHLIFCWRHVLLIILTRREFWNPRANAENYRISRPFEVTSGPSASFRQIFNGKKQEPGIDGILCREIQKKYSRHFRDFKMNASSEFCHHFRSPTISTALKFSKTWNHALHLQQLIRTYSYMLMNDDANCRSQGSRISGTKISTAHFHIRLRSLQGVTSSPKRVCAPI